MNLGRILELALQLPLAARVARIQFFHIYSQFLTGDSSHDGNGDLDSGGTWKSLRWDLGTIKNPPLAVDTPPEPAAVQLKVEQPKVQHVTRNVTGAAPLREVGRVPSELT